MLALIVPFHVVNQQSIHWMALYDLTRRKLYNIKAEREPELNTPYNVLVLYL